ncbi:hypothetical protein HN789_02945 [archaeon]|nr:hypothetical protein [archaeon]MBT4271909.1 hypothetical protein [archaeon]MBT4461008.1 hypothetical protein [archaeon]MBT4858416.1 hypothetical protein [archaeon]MBT5424149.1 hypothetical protein [archaeon]
MMDSKLNNLAETLTKSGLASSASQAMLMAKNIMGTEKKVSKDFDGKATQINRDLTEKKTYQEEIDELIQKTSPEKKDFHYMVSGYKRAVVKEEETKPQIFNELEEKEESLKSPVKEQAPVLEEPDVSEILADVKKEPETIVESVSPTQIPLPAPEHVVQPILEEKSKEPKLESSNIEEVKVQEEPVLESSPEPVMQNQAIANAIKEAQPVYTSNPILEDDRLLKDIMDEQANEVYKNSEPSVSEPVAAPIQPEVSSPVNEVQNESTEDVPEYTVFNIESEEISETKVSDDAQKPKRVSDKPMTNDSPVEPVQSEPEATQPLVEEKIENQSDDFILPVSNDDSSPESTITQSEPVIEEVPAQPEQQEISDKKEFKNPIPKVNLMDHFKFG